MFNENSKLKNILLSSAFGVVEQFFVYFLAFVYRTVFLFVLSKNYLGISGLFTNILQVFSLAELGIGSVISYRMYEPIKKCDKDKCSALLNFYRRVYSALAGIILLLGGIFYPFLPCIIADSNEIPSDINLGVIYWLFVIQSASSYICIYMQSLLSADQKNYVISFMNTLYNILSNILKIVVLVISKDYTFSLFVGIIANVLYNVLFSKYIKKEYKFLIDKTKKLDREEKKGIYQDTAALMCHKIGYVILNSTDSIILSKYIGVNVLGIYSNYSMISTAIDAVLNKLLGSFVSTIGNISLDSDEEKKYDIYKKLKFCNMWLASLCSVCFGVLINPFICLWLDESYLLDIWVVIILSTNMFLNSSRIINNVYVNANGLFVKDRIRPLVQSIINIVVSIVMVIKFGIGGVFVGTIVSCLGTCWWREPVILYRYAFQKGVSEYFKDYLKWMFLTIGVGGSCYVICGYLSNNILGFIGKIAICIILLDIIYAVIFNRTDEYKFYYTWIKEQLNKKLLKK